MSLAESLTAIKFQAGLRQLPVATVTEKLHFPIKFEREKFCLEFSSESPSSDCEASIRRSKIRIAKKFKTNRKQLDFSDKSDDHISTSSLSEHSLEFKFEKTRQDSSQPICETES